MAYPVLTAPAAGKAATGMVCPEKHIATAREFLKNCSRFLIIGASGLDDDLWELLSDLIRAKSPRRQFVSGSAEQAKEVSVRFSSGVGAFRSPAGKLKFSEGGFREYVTTNAIIEFLRG